MGRRRKRLEAEKTVQAVEDDLDRLFPVHPRLSSPAVVPFPGDEERTVAAEVLAEKTWPQITWEGMGKDWELPFCLTPEGFVYYLPAFIRMCRHEPDSTELLSDTLLNCFGRQDGEWPAVLARLNEGQRHCAYEFLKSRFIQPARVGTSEFAVCSWRREMVEAQRALGFEGLEELPPSDV